MTVVIHFAGGSEPIRTLPDAYSKEMLARALSGLDERNHRVGEFQRVQLGDGKEALINPAAVAYLYEVSP